MVGEATVCDINFHYMLDIYYTYPSIMVCYESLRPTGVISGCVDRFDELAFSAEAVSRRRATPFAVGGVG